MPKPNTGQQIKAMIDSGKYADARRLTNANPSSKQKAVLDRIDLEEARTLIKKGRYKQARPLLMANNDAGAAPLLANLNAMERPIPVATAAPPPPPDVAPDIPPAKIAKSKDNDDSPETKIVETVWMGLAMWSMADSIFKLFDD